MPPSCPRWWSWRFPIDAPEWRRWQNTEIYAETGGLRLEETNDAIRSAAITLMRASLSAKGYEQSINAMRLNRFLGDLVGGPAVMNEWSYSLSLFGEPSLTEPWGWQCFRLNRLAAPVSPRSLLYAASTTSHLSGIAFRCSLTQSREVPHLREGNVRVLANYPR
jgi:hypothetical protein